MNRDRSRVGRKRGLTDEIFVAFHQACDERDNARRMSHMVNDLLEMARVRLGSGITLSPIQTSLRHICETVVEELQAVFPNRRFHINGNDELLGRWDQNRLSQVVSNLVTNAVQRGATGSAVTLTVKGSAGGAEVRVHNEGTPIPPELIPKLFDSFYQLDGGDFDIQSSLGLGLYIANEIIAAHGGNIDV